MWEGGGRGEGWGGGTEHIVFMCMYASINLRRGVGGTENEFPIA